MENSVLLHVGQNFYLPVQITQWNRYLRIRFLFSLKNGGLDAKNICDAWDNKGDIVIENDVWIGYEAVILSGVTIGDGAIIGARAVVTKDVPSYTVVGGVPAKPIRKRFDEGTIQKLEEIRCWDWEEERIKKNIQAIQSGDISMLERMN